MLDKIICVSVRSLVEFILRSGDIDNRGGGGFDQEAMLAGGRIHRKIQKGMAGDYRAEVALSDEVDCGAYVLKVEGRADGVFTDDGSGGAAEDAANAPLVMVDEIKGVYMDPEELEEPVPVHLAQAKCYGAILLLHYLDEGWGGIPCRTDMIGIRMTYVNLEDDSRMRYFTSVYEREEILSWYGDLCAQYRKWTAWQIRWQNVRDASMEPLTFPFAYRKGQKGLVSSVYHAIVDERELFLMAPTGVGKTMAVVYPSVRAVGQGLADKIFYLTAKNQTLAVGAEAFRILSGKGLRMKVIVLTSKEKICPLSEPSCNPDDCPYAKGHFDRVNDAVYEMLGKPDLSDGDAGQAHLDFYDRDAIWAQADKWKVCPFELSLDISSWCDAVLCDYNYAFDPNARLRRFFGEGMRGKYIFLVDEAHNLVDRAREMYSAELVKEDVLAAKNAIKGASPKLARQLERLNKLLLKMRKKLTAEEDGESDRLGKYEKIGELDDKFVRETLGTYGMMQEYFKERSGLRRDGSAESFVGDDNMVRSFESGSLMHSSEPGSISHSAGNDRGSEAEAVVTDRLAEKADALLEFYFELRDFVSTYEVMADDYVIYSYVDGEKHFHLKLFCMSPARRLQEVVDKGRAAVFFSATFLPASYYKELLSRREDPYAAYAESPFDDERKVILIGQDVSTRYRSRGDAMYRRIAFYIHETVLAKKGNYMAFFPSYRFMQDVLRIYQAEFDEEEVDYVAQSRYMNEMDREIFLENFYEDPGRTMVGFCVMGGIFAEGIDLAGSKLIGSIIVGCGLPQVSAETELIREHYDGKDQTKQGLEHVDGKDQTRKSLELVGGEGKTKQGLEHVGGEDQTKQGLELVDGKGQTKQGFEHGSGKGLAKKGFSYAYLIPGMNKVMQSAGRVIRTATDRGVIVLLDDRFLGRECQSLFPREWKSYIPCRAEQVRGILAAFWERGVP